MKKINIIILSVLSLGSLITGCKPDEHKDFSTLVKNTASTVEITGVPAAMVVNESVDDVVATITVSLSEPQIVDVHVPITQIGGDAEDGADFELSTTDLVFPAYTTGPQTFTLTILDDDIVEADETLQLQIGNELTSNVNITPAVMDVKITNATDLEFDMSFSWGRSYVLHYWDFTGSDPKDTTLSTSSPYNPNAPDFPSFISNFPIIDIDFYVFDSLGSAVGNEVGYDDAKSASHPENYTFYAPDDEGTYIVASAMYFNIFRLLGYGAVTEPQGPMPITTTFSRKGVLEPITLVQDDVSAYNSNTLDQENDGDGTFTDLFKVVVKPDMFIVYKLDGSTFATARKKQFVPRTKKVLPPLIIPHKK